MEGNYKNSAQNAALKRRGQMKGSQNRDFMQPPKVRKMGATTPEFCQLGEHELIYIFGYLRSSKLLEIRSISKLWNDVAKPILRKRLDLQTSVDNSGRSAIYLEFLEQDPGFTAPVMELRCQTLFGDGDGMSAKKYLEVIEQVSKLVRIRKLIWNFRLEYCEFSNGKTITTAWLSQILQNVSPTLQILAVRSMFCVGVEEPHETETLVILNSLHTLEIQEPISKPFVFLWTKILQSAPNISRLLTKNLNRDNYIAIHLTNVLHDLGKTSQMKQLQFRYLNDNDSLKCLEMLTNTRELALEDLQLSEISASPDVYTTVKKLLEKQREKLKILLLDFNSASAFKWNFSLPGLRELSIKTNGTNKNPVSPNFARDTPALHSLKLSFNGTPPDLAAGLETDWKHFICFSANTQEPSKTLREIEFRNLNTRDPEFVWYLGRIFPAVRKSVWNDCSPHILKSLGSIWDNLEELEISTWYGDGKQSLDELLFGLTPEWKKGTDTTAENWWENVKPPTITPGCIGNCTGLRRLRITSSPVLGGGWIGPLTDVAIYFGLSKMTRLVELTISCKANFSQKGKEFLRLKLTQLEKLEVPSYRY